ncbi:hypothetical protein EZS27_025892 [termite gut metagenome]|uniref:ISXO2-like transposase domain-containing protein n=1 Tax=termite gut metagenome TaxID=433724 RepID=A0A5J4QWD7_9ZZZZ
MGLKSREGKVKAYVIETPDTKTLTSNIRENVKVGANLYTDQWKGYKGLTEYNHTKVKHNIGEYVRYEDGHRIHTNGIEGF